MSAPGRVRRRLASLIPSLNHSNLATRNRPRVTVEFTCDPVNLWPAEGAWRTNMHMDVMPWHGQSDAVYTYWNDDGTIKQQEHKRYGLCSWFTMTDICRAGIIDECEHRDAEGELYPVVLSPLTAARAAVAEARWRGES